MSCSPVKSKRRIALVIQYDGSNFLGWQKQSNGITVQGLLDEAIASFGVNGLDPICSVAAGRTDSGVHASGQVIHFDYLGPIPAFRWASALNGRLPNTIRVLESVEQPLEWHACHSAIYRRYRYTIYNGIKPNVFLNNWSWHRYQFRLDERLMKVALKQLLGRYDFSAFQKSGSNRSHAWTTIQDVQIDRNGDLINLEIQASGFLYGMVRLLVGQLVAVGEHRLTIGDFENLWRKQLRKDVRESAPSKGLCLIRVGYEKLVFSKPTYFDTFPSWFLPLSNPPRDP